MNFKALIPDFGAIGRTDWSKPSVDTKNVWALGAILAAVLMVIFVFLPWFGLDIPFIGPVTRLGITLWYGIFGFIFALVAICSTLYMHYSLGFWASLLGVIMGLLGMICWASLTYDGDTQTAAELKEGVEAFKSLASGLGSKGEISTIRYGAILYFVSALVGVVANFFAATGIQLKK